MIDVAFLPEEATFFAHTWLVVDVLRATTSICAFFERDGGRLFPVENVEEARNLHKMLGEETLLFGERGGLPPEGFDEAGNSPSRILDRYLEGQCAVLSTTNGTRTLMCAREANTAVFAACARNATAVMAAALERGDSVGILCAGDQGRISFGDALCAGLLLRTAAARGERRFGEGARMALRLLDRETQGDFPSLLASTRHAKALVSLGFKEDIEVASAIDVTDVVPELTGEYRPYFIRRGERQ